MINLSEFRLYGDSEEYTFWTHKDGRVIQLDKVNQVYKMMVDDRDENGKFIGNHWEAVEASH